MVMVVISLKDLSIGACKSIYKAEMFKSIEDADIKKTLDVLKNEYDSKRAATNKELCLVIGNKQAGKSTLIQFLATNGNAIESIAKCPKNEAFFIDLKAEADYNATSYTLLQSNEDDDGLHNLQFLEFLNFEEIENFENYIIKVMSINKTVNQAMKMKVLLVVDVDMILSNNQNSKFSVFFQQVTKILDSISDIKLSIGLVITKVKPKMKHSVIFQKVRQLLKKELKMQLENPSNSAAIKYQVLSEFMEISTLIDCERFSSRYNKNIVELFKTLLQSNKESFGCRRVRTPKHITIFRMPEKLGLVSDNELLQKDKTNILRLIRRLEYSQGAIKLDLSYPLWESHTDYISKLIINMKSKLWALTNILFEYYDIKIVNCTNIFELKRLLNTENTYFRAILPHAQQAFEFILQALAELLEELASQAQMYQSFVNNELPFLIEVLQFLYASKNIFQSSEFETVGAPLQNYFEKWHKFSTFLLTLEEMLSNMAINEEIFLTFNMSEGWLITKDNFQFFLAKVGELGIAVNLEDLPVVEDLFLKHLNELLVKKLAVSLPDLKKNLRQTIVAKDYVLVIGNAGVGKTTLIEFLTSNSLIPKNIENRSKSTIPNVVTHGFMHYIDCPSWIDESNFNSRLEMMMLIEDLLMIMDSFKLLLVVEMDKPGMAEFLLKAVFFVHDIEKYRQSIGIIVTKSENSDLDMDNDTFVSSLLNEVLQSSEITEQGKKFFKRTLSKRNEKYERLGFLPNMSAIDQPQNYKNLLKGMIGNLNYMQANTDDFNYTACLKVEIALAFVVRALDDQYREKLVEICDIFQLEQDLIDIDLKIKSFISVATDLEKQDSISFTKALMTLARIDEKYSKKHLALLPEYTSSNLLCMLGSLTNKNNLRYGISNAFTSVLSIFLIDLQQALSKYEVQQNKHLYNVENINDWGKGSTKQTSSSGINITGENVHVFLKKIKEMVKFDHTTLSDYQCLDDALLKNINRILTDTLKTETTFTHIQSERKLHVRGSFVLSSSLPIDLLEEVYEVEIYATNVIFIDKNINCMIKLKKITIVSPSVEIQVPTPGVVDFFIICKKLIFEHKEQNGMYGILDQNALQIEKTKQARNFYNYDHCSCQLTERYIKYLELSKQESIQMSKFSEFIVFIGEESKRYLVTKFGEQYQADLYLTLKSLISQLQSLDLLYFESKLKQPMLHWYRTMLVQVQDYQNTRQLDNLEKAVCENLYILIATKINSFANLSQQQQLLINVETHYQKMKKGLKRIYKLDVDEALRLLNTNSKEKLYSKIMEVEVYLTKMFGKFDNVRLDATTQINRIFNIEGEYQNKQVIEAVIVQIIVDIVLAINAKLKITKVAVETVAKQLEYGSQTEKTNHLIKNFTELCNEYRKQFLNLAVDAYNSRLEIFIDIQNHLSTKISIRDIGTKILHLQYVKRDDDIENLIQIIEGEFESILAHLKDVIEANTVEAERLMGIQIFFEFSNTQNQDIINELSTKLAILADKTKGFPELEKAYKLMIVNVDKNMDILRLEQKSQPKDDILKELKDNIDTFLNKLNALSADKIHQLDLLQKIQQNYELVVLSSDLYFWCKNDSNKIDGLHLEMQQWKEGLTKLSCFKTQIQKSVFSAMINIKTTYKDVPLFLKEAENCSADRLFCDFKEFLTSFLQDFEMHNFSIDFLEKTHAAVQTVDQIYSYVEQYQSQIDIVETFERKDLNKPKTINDDMLEKFFMDIDDRIKSNVILKEYNMGLVGFKNFVFPFAHECLPNLLMDNCNRNGKMDCKQITTVLFTNTIENIKLIRRKTKDSDYPILQLLEQRTVKYNFSQNSVVPAIFVWKHEQHSKAIWNLLKGNPVTLMADINRGCDADGLKFCKLELSFQAKNGQQQNLIDNHLKQATIKMRHSGNSYYKVENKIYLITSEVVRFKSTFSKDKNDELVQPNYLKNIKNNVPILSPFTTWKFQVVLKNKKNLGVLFEAGLEIDLLMLGSCSYLAPSSKYDLHVSEHYQLVE
jgi:energy-coupling factor transporter ATP-binding protein EcfA2